MKQEIRSFKKPPTALRLPIMKLDGYRLVSGVASNEQWPDSFPIPPEWLRCGLGTQHSAKLIFEISAPDDQRPFCERMWVNVKGREGPYYVGSLHNQPACYGVQRKLKRGARVVFLPEHVIDVLFLSKKAGGAGDPFGDLSWLIRHDLDKYGAKHLRRREGNDGSSSPPG